jgi:HPt (histidine-containing phosphotransfer) domain-containing protein
MNLRTLNVSILLKQFSGDEEILLDMINIFQDSLNSLLGPIRESIETKNGTQLRINAHTLKGVMRNFYAEVCEQMAQDLEVRGKNLKFDDALEVLNQLEDQLMVLIFELHILKKNIIKNE